MPVAQPKNRSERLNVRVTAAQARLIRLGAKAARANVSSFLADSACIRAEETLASQTNIVFTADQWEKFHEMLDRPAKEHPRLKRLLTEPSVIERD